MHSVCLIKLPSQPHGVVWQRDERRVRRNLTAGFYQNLTQIFQEQFHEN